MRKPNQKSLFRKALEYAAISLAFLPSGCGRYITPIALQPIPQDADSQPQPAQQTGKQKYYVALRCGYLKATNEKTTDCSEFIGGLEFGVEFPGRYQAGISCDWFNADAKYLSSRVFSPELALKLLPTNKDNPLRVLVGAGYRETETKIRYSSGTQKEKTQVSYVTAGLGLELKFNEKQALTLDVSYIRADGSENLPDVGRFRAGWKCTF